MRHPFFLSAVLLLTAVSRALAVDEPGTFASEDVARVRGMLEDLSDAVADHYHPYAKIDAAHRKRIDAADKQLGAAKSNNEANAIVADAFAALDPRIRLYPPRRTVRVDYGWDCRIVGNDVYVIHVDSDGAALKLGLRLGDRILSADGVPLTRESASDFFYAINVLAPRPGLLVVAQSSGATPRELAIPATMRPQRRTREYRTPHGFALERERSELQRERTEEFRDLNTHLHRVGSVLIWRAEELDRRVEDVAAALKAARDASALIIDLRGIYVNDHEVAMRLLDGLFDHDFEVGKLEENRLERPLRVKGKSDAFLGPVLVLIDAETENYGELVARVIQEKQRGVLIGDHTHGRVFEHFMFRQARGLRMGFTAATVVMPSAEVRLADGFALDGHGVGPDLLLLPTSADLAGRRDVVMAKALAMLKQNVPAEEAGKFFRTEPDDDESY